MLSADGVLRVYDGGDLASVHDTRAPGGPVVYDPAHYTEALSGKRWCADGDIEEAARRNLRAAAAREACRPERAERPARPNSAGRWS